MNILESEIRKVRHLPSGHWLYLCALPNSKWCVVLCDEDDETFINSMFCFTYVQALHVYNQWRKDEKEDDDDDD